MLIYYYQYVIIFIKINKQIKTDKKEKRKKENIACIIILQILIIYEL